MSKETITEKKYSVEEIEKFSKENAEEIPKEAFWKRTEWLTGKNFNMWWSYYATKEDAENTKNQIGKTRSWK